ncbi:MAG TPA: hypothetical protein VM093_06460 [Aeromicrobium sp.]|nr:hypothetical protein [Aeromicrobium sp.]
MTDVETKETSRRVVLGGAAVLGAGVVLSACGGGDSPVEAPTGATEPARPGGAD